MDQNKTIPLLLGAGVVAVLVLTRNPKPKDVAPPLPPPQQTLQQQFEQILAQGLQNPGSVDPERLDALAAQLQAAGMTQQADQLRALAAQVRANRALPPPGTVPTGPLPTDLSSADLTRWYNDLLAQDPSHVDIPTVLSIVAQLNRAGRTVEGNQLVNLVARARQLQPLPPPGGATPAGMGIPGQLPLADRELLNQLCPNGNCALTPPGTSYLALEALATRLEPYGFLTQVTQLRQRAAQLRAADPLAPPVGTGPRASPLLNPFNSQRPMVAQLRNQMRFQPV